MNFRRHLLMATTVILGLSLAGDAMADISNAAVLFLRIAPGSRAAGMGEAYVAIADDATATHWNPAGLGNYPLADTWIEALIPEAYRPLRGFAPLSTGGDNNYLDYDIWAITPQGLIRYDNKKWQTEELFGTRTDETVGQKVKEYFQISDETRLASMIDRVAARNNDGTVEELSALRDRLLSHFPADYDQLETVTGYLDSLRAAYRRCLINWDRVHEARDKLNDALKDSSLTETECDRVAVALERSRNRYLPEELRIPYSALFDSEPTAVASNGEILLVGSSQGLARFNGKNWTFVTDDAGQPITGITSLHPVGSTIIVGTDSGVGVFRGITVSPLTNESAGIPSGRIDAIGGNALTELYAVVNQELYRFNGMAWTNAINYTVAIDDTLQKISARYSIYGTSADEARFIEKYKDLQTELPVQQTIKSTPADSTGADSTSAESATPVPMVGGIPGVDAPLTPGLQIRVPLAASVKGEVRSIFVDVSGRLWLGTDLGVVYFDGQRWVMPGYAAHTVAAGETLDSLVAVRKNLSDEQRAAYRAQLVDINDLTTDEPAEGASIRIYRTPAAQPVNEISGDGKIVYVATDDGLIECEGSVWSRTGLRGLTHENIVGLRLLGRESWIAGDSRLVVKGRGHSEISLMHVNWLPELASDLYYEFLAVTKNKEWGTIGASITFISYGQFLRTGEQGDTLGQFESYDFAAALSYGTSLHRKVKGGISAKIIHSRLSPQGAGAEQGSGTSTGIAVDLGVLWLINSRLTFGAAFTNLGPKMTYIDAAQSDDLPRNLAFGFAYKLLRSDYTSLIVTAEWNKLMVGLNSSTKVELTDEAIFNVGGEFTYANLFAARAGYIYDKEGEIKTPTIGFGLSPFTWGEFDFAYIPSQKDFSLANTLRVSLRIIL